MTTPNPALATALNQLKIKYTQGLAGKIAEMDAICPRHLPTYFTLDSLLKLTRVAHKLAGSGKTFDLPAISDAGHRLEMLLSKAVAEMDSGSLSSGLQSDVGDAVFELKQACQQAISAAKPEAVEILPPSKQDEKQKQVVIATGNGDVVDVGQLMEQLQYLGYDAKLAGTIEDLARSDDTHAPMVLIIATDFLPGDNAAIQAYLKKREKLGHDTPILYLTPENSFDMRLAAIRSGGDAFLTLPVDNLHLIDKLGTLAERSHAYHFHVLIVDDDEILATRYGIALEKVGMSVTVLTDPKQSLEVLSAASIDLVLMDFDMPHCNGYELASMLRQMDNYVRLPILFLSTQANLDSLIRHSHLGIDDFLTKPVSVEQLVTAVHGRAARSSVLHKFIDQDSATGLLNHTRLKKELALETSRAARKKGQFTYALLDIDHFKMVNDTFGHAMGDVVIKTLAHLLRQRLRFTDIIGRYGGEEFGVILPEADAQAAFKILQQIHIQFAGIVFTADDQEFNVTFSGGIADFPNFAGDVQLSMGADQALYKAKRQGRNQLVVATSKE